MYKDDGLSCFHNFSVPESEKIKRKFCEIFKQNDLNISVECNLQITDFLDVTFDLRTGKCYSYMNCYLLTSNQIIYHLSLSKFQPWSVKKYLTFHVIKSALISCPLTTITHLETVVSTKKSSSHHKLLKEKKSTETFCGLICRSAATWWSTLTIYFRKF